MATCLSGALQHEHRCRRCCRSSSGASPDRHNDNAIVIHAPHSLQLTLATAVAILMAALTAGASASDSVHASPGPLRLSAPRPELPAVAPFALPRAFGAAWRQISVTDYGAVGDGVSNDGPAIQAAIDAALADGSLSVWFPPGDYVTNQTILASGSADRPTKSPVSLRGFGTAANTRIMLRLAKPPPSKPALPTSVVKFQGASMGEGASICPEVSGGFCAGCGVFSHTVIENLAIDATVSGDPLGNNTVGVEWAAVIGGTVRSQG